MQCLDCAGFLFYVYYMIWMSFCPCHCHHEQKGFTLFNSDIAVLLRKYLLTHPVNPFFSWTGHQ